MKIKVCKKCKNYMRHVSIVYGEKEKTTQTIVFSGRRSQSLDDSVKIYPEALILEDFSFCDLKDGEKCPYELERLILEQ